MVSKRPRFRIILLVLYLFIGGTLFGVCFINMGHSPWCRWSYYSLMPAGLIGSVASYLLVPWGLVKQGSPAWQILETVLVPVSFLVACLQYYFIGFVVDKLIGRRR